MRKVRASGFLIYREKPRRQFLLMKHKRRWDLPKGHQDDGDESDLETALRELREETGIRKSQVEVDPKFRHQTVYEVYERRYNGEKAEKTLVLFLARLVEDVDIELTEHLGFEWFDWKPPHRIQEFTIDPLLEAVAKHWKR